MRLLNVRIRNYRTIRDEQQLQVENGLVIVGPNNTGKTNLLRALELVFTGRENQLGYSVARDRTFGIGKKQTSLVASFRCEDGPKDEDVLRDLDELHRLQGTTRDGSMELSLNVYFTDGSTPVYRCFPNTKRPGGANGARYSRAELGLVDKVIEQFSCHYVPSNKRFATLYEELVVSFLRHSVATVLEAHVHDILGVLYEAGDGVTSLLDEFGLPNIGVSIRPPKGSLVEMLSGFDLQLLDPHETPLTHKGMGIQAAVMLAFFIWVTQEEKRRGKGVIWLIEEPESFLHPELAGACNRLLRRLGGECTVVVTTHSLRFVPQDPLRVVGTQLKDGHTEVVVYATYKEATARIRSALGVRFSDYYNLAWYTVFVEGPSDRELLIWFLGRMPAEGEAAWPCLRSVEMAFLDFGGVKALEGFLMATYEHMRGEIPIVVLLDGDDAGDRSRRALQGYFGNKSIPFQAGTEWVITRDRFAVEGLFPDPWILALQGQHPGWFVTAGVDANGQLLPFQVRDDRKRELQNALMARAEDEQDLGWADRWCAVCAALDSGLERAAARLAEAEGGA